MATSTRSNCALPTLACDFRWFGAKSLMPLSNDLRELIIDNMRLVIDAKQEVPDNEL